MPFVWNSSIEDKVEFFDIEANHHNIVSENIYFKAIADRLAIALTEVAILNPIDKQAIPTQI